jgi:hypothetical protein
LSLSCASAAVTPDPAPGVVKIAQLELSQKLKDPFSENSKKQFP